MSRIWETYFAVVLKLSSSCVCSRRDFTLLAGMNKTSVSHLDRQIDWPTKWKVDSVEMITRQRAVTLLSPPYPRTEDVPRPCPPRYSPLAVILAWPACDSAWRSITIASSHRIYKEHKERGCYHRGRAIGTFRATWERRGFECTWHGFLVAGNEIPQLGPPREGLRSEDGER